jgi:hypothetical protein
VHEASIAALKRLNAGAHGDGRGGLRLLEHREIRVDRQCFGCTAGAGAEEKQLPTRLLERPTEQMHDGVRSLSPVARGVGIETRQEIHGQTQASPLPRNVRFPRQRRHFGAPLLHVRSVPRG